MKKLKMFMPILGLTTLTGMVVPITSCQDYDRTVTLYTEYGTFSNGEKFINIHANGATLLKDIDGYEQPSLPSYQFTGWTDEKGKAFKEDKYVNGDLVLVANFDEGELAEPKDFSTDSWATVIAACETGYVSFAQAYCGYEGTDIWQAISAINNFTTSKKNKRNVFLSFEDDAVLAPVRLIGANCEIVQDATLTISFTFEFTEVIDMAPFNYFEASDNLWSSSYLNHYLNNARSDFGGFILRAMPDVIWDYMIPVQKQTIVTNYDGTRNTSDYSNDYLFPLSRYEMNDINGNADEGDADESKEEYSFVYPYYAHFTQTTTWDQMPARVKNYVGTNSPINYWTRSPYLGDYNGDQADKESWEEQYGREVLGGVVYDGGVHPQYVMSSSIGIAPAFVIGEYI